MNSPLQKPHQQDNAAAKSPAAPPPRRGPLTRFLDIVEWLGNLLPHPVTLFALFALAVIVLSGILDAFGLQVDDPRTEGEVIRVVSLMSGDGFRMIIENLVTNFTGFVPLGTVLVALLGVGVAEKSGLLSAAIRFIVLGAPKNMVTMAVVFAGVLSNTASEMGYVVLIPLATVMFHSLGRHPFAGLAAAFAGVSGGYSANLLIGTVDPLLAGITQEAAQLVDPTYEVHAAVNWYFMIASTFLVTFLGTWVTARVVEPKLGPYDDSRADKTINEEATLEPLTKQEKRALAWAGVAAMGMVLLFIYFAGPGMLSHVMGWIPGYGVLRNPETGELLRSPFLRGVVAMIFMFFIVPGYLYGRLTGVMKSDRDVIDAMADAMSSMGLYIVLVFFAAQFVSYFGWTNLGTILAVLGADFIVWMRLDNPLVFIPFILMCCLVNLLLGSASAQWAVTAPIFVPMLMYVGYSPEVIQAAYRIGDSTTNIITPMMSYFGIIFAFACRYDKKLGIGTLISIMLPYTIYILTAWVVLFYVWVFLLGFPVGPEAPTYYTLE